MEKEKQPRVLLPDWSGAHTQHMVPISRLRADAGAGTSMQSAGINTSVIVTFA